MTGPANTALSGGTKDDRLAGPMAGLLIAHKIGSFDDLEGAGLEAMDAVGEYHSEKDTTWRHTLSQGGRHRCKLGAC